MYAENEPTIKRNEAVLNDLPGTLHNKANDKIPLALIPAAQNQK